MLVPLSVSSSDAHSHHDHKFSTGHLYLRQQHTVQIIQLVEGPPPPPRKITSVIASSTYSSSYSSSEDDEESACSSYCSSDMPPEQSSSSLGGDQPSTLSQLSHETYSTTKRILAWRDNFSADLGPTASEPSTLKRKINLEECDDIMSKSSKRSRSQASQGGASASSLGMHSCPACDAFFQTRQSLRQHGRDANANEACSVAVEYAFE